MSNNSLEIYNKINKYEDVKKLIGSSENIFLDFKMSSTADGVPTKDDKFNFCKALSGFSHQEGGLIVWGLECKRDTVSGADIVTKEVPIPFPAKFDSGLDDFFPYTTEPLVDGVLHKHIYVNDDTATDKGFVVLYVPKSHKSHRVLDPKKNILFYKRYGASFRPIETTEEIRSLMLRQTAPELEVNLVISSNYKNNIHIEFDLKNTSHVTAKSVSIYFKTEPVVGFTYFDGGGNDRWDTWTQAISGGGSRTFMLNNGLSVHPDQEMKAFIAAGALGGGSSVKSLKVMYTVYAEGMEPKHGQETIEIT